MKVCDCGSGNMQRNCDEIRSANRFGLRSTDEPNTVAGSDQRQLSSMFITYSMDAEFCTEDKSNSSIGSVAAGARPVESVDPSLHRSVESWIVSMESGLAA